MMSQKLVFLVLGAMLSGADAASCLKVAADEAMPVSTPATAAKLVLFGPDPQKGGAVVALQDVAAAASNSVPLKAGAVWRLSQDASDKIKARVVAASSSDRPKYRLGFVTTGGADILDVDDVLLFFNESALDDPGRAQACAVAPGPASLVSTPVPADSATCASQLARLESRRYLSWVLFNSAGAVCYAPFPLRQRDTLAFGLVLNDGEKRPDAINVSVSSCTAPTQGPVVLPSGAIPAVFIQTSRSSGVRVEEIGLRTECGSAGPVVAITFTRDGKAFSPSRA